jgi:hypothetical protein
MRPARPTAALLLTVALAACGTQASPEAGSAAGSGQWHPVAESPLGPRESATMVWTGHEVLVLGGDTSPCPPSADCMAASDPPREAAAYDPVTDTWRAVAPLPVTPHWPRAVAAARAVYVLDGGGGTPLTFLSWNPDADTWRELPAPPGALDGLSAVGDRIVAYQTSNENGLSPDSLFDPASGTWTPLPDPPGTPGFDRAMVALDEHTLALLDLELVPNPGGDGPTLYRAAVLDLTASRWRRFADSDISGLYGGWHAVGGRLVTASTPTVDGGNVGNYGRDVPTGGILDPATGTWSALPARDDEHVGPAVGEVAGDGVVVSDGWALHVADGRWERLPDLDRLDGVSGQSSVWAGDQLMVWGGARFDDKHPAGELLGTGWTWRPAGEVTTTNGADATPTDEVADRTGAAAWRLVGSWQLSVDGPNDGDVLRLAPGDLSIWQDCGVLQGSWRADREGLFVGSLWGGSGSCIQGKLPTIPWLDAAAGWRRAGDGIELLDANGEVVARLQPGGRPTPGPDIAASEAEPPVVVEAEKAHYLGSAPALPGGVTAAGRTDLVGRWVPAHDDGEKRPEQPYVELRGDGTYRASDGCNGTMGRWVAGRSGSVLATAGVTTLIGCHNLYVAGYVVGAHAAGLTDDGTLVLVDDHGAETGRLRRAG